jgi:hypothetical protein
MSNTTHFISQGYTVIKTPMGQYSFLGTGKAEMLDHMSQITAAIRRVSASCGPHLILERRAMQSDALHH